MQSIEPGFDLKAYLREIERDLILKAMALSGNVKAQAARRLGMKRTALFAKLKVLGLHEFINPLKNKAEEKVLQGACWCGSAGCPRSGAARNNAQTKEETQEPEIKKG